MRKATLVVFTALAALAVSATAVIPANAAECKKNTTTFMLCLGEPLQLTTGTFNLHTTNDPSPPTKAWVLTGLSGGTQVTCPEILLSLSATLTSSSGPASVRGAGIVVHFIGCAAPKPAHCVVNNELIISTTLDGVSVGKDELVLLLPEKGVTFATIKFESSGGTCVIAGNDRVTSENGKEGEGPLCRLPGIEKTTVLHLVECKGGKENSHLEAGLEPVEFTGNASVLLTSGTKWAVILGE
jgi:hypothetical protein